MHAWHRSPRTPRQPRRPVRGEPVLVHVATAPVAPGQRVWVDVAVESPTGDRSTHRVDATWRHNTADESHWTAELGAFPRGARVRYEVHAGGDAGRASAGAHGFTVGPRVHVALLWHQHQPSYVDTTAADRRGSHLWPWVRLHAARDYVGMPLLAAAEPDVRTTFNLTPVLLAQIEDLLDGATDRAEELSRRSPARLTDDERAFLFRTFFDAHEAHQIGRHPRYRDLHERHARGASFSSADVRDLQVWFNLAWCAIELRQGEVALPGGRTASVRHLVEKGSGFGESDVEHVLGVHRQLLEAVVPVHRELEARGAIELTSTPFHHPILPLLIDASAATFDRPGASAPAPFRRPEDARAHVTRSLDSHQARFGRRPRGMWPAEGAVSQAAAGLFAEAGVRWIATDRGVLAASGDHGYDADDPDVAAQAWRVTEGAEALTLFFRDTPLSDAIGFHYYAMDADEAVARFMDEVRGRFARRFASDGDHVVPVILDGENAWGAFPDDGRPFLRALYRALAQDDEVSTTTFSGWIDGEPARGVDAHPLAEQPRVHALYTGSWIDESGSAPGVELGTWVGEAEENEAWRLLGETRDFLDREGATPESAPEAFEALYVAQGSDWFWWYGDDQDSGRDDEFDALFRMHLKNVYRALGQPPPAELDRHIVPRAPVWTADAPVERIQPGDRLVVRAPGAGTLAWWSDADAARREAPLVPVGGVMAGAVAWQRVLGPFGADVRRVWLVLTPDDAASPKGTRTPAEAEVRVE